MEVTLDLDSKLYLAINANLTLHFHFCLAASVVLQLFFRPSRLMKFVLVMSCVFLCQWISCLRGPKFQLTDSLNQLVTSFYASYTSNYNRFYKTVEDMVTPI